jgi:sugar phosphate isomerase/epimerase
VFGPSYARRPNAGVALDGPPFDLLTASTKKDGRPSEPLTGCVKFWRMQGIPFVSRRSFLALAGALPFALKAAAAEYKNIPPGIELYTVRDELTKDLTGTLRAVAKMGYKIVEFYAPYYSWTPDMAKDVRKLMDDLGIRCYSTHNGAQSFAAAGIQKAIDLNQIIGSRYLIMSSPPGNPTTVDGWKNVANVLNTAVEKLKPLGMSSGYHNHQNEWKPIEGQRPMDVLAKNTVKDVVLQFDVGTCVEVGEDPIAWINANPGRIKSVHCKDWSPGAGYATMFGEGVAPWAKIFQAVEATGGVEYYLIEQEQGPADEQLLRAEKCMANWKKLRA